MRKPLIYCLIFTPLIITALFYYFFRDGTVTYQALGIESNRQHFFNSNIINALPSFAHVYSFSLATWLVNGQKNGLFSALLWVIINVTFELGQALSRDQVSNFPAFIANYFINGSFNWFDIAAIVIGGIAAYLTTLKLSEEQIR